MGKKYLLYIHDDRFAEESKKSNLINQLLSQHYEPRAPTPGFSQVPVPQSLPFVPRPPDPETGYPCCLGKRPCKHWVWDSGAGLYRNSLTDKVREPDIL